MNEEYRNNVSDNNKDGENQQSSAPIYHTREEYIIALQNWINQARMWNTFTTCLPFYLRHQHLTRSTPSQSPPSSTSSSRTSSQGPTPREEQPTPGQEHGDEDRNGLAPTEGFEFVIPPVWKRVLAEVVDFIILFVVKLALTLLALEVMDPSDWNFLKEHVVSGLGDLTIGTELTTGIIMLEAIHRLVVCAYEIYWLHGTEDMRFGCATPGKTLLGITVIVVTKIHQLEPANRSSQRVLVYPGTDLGLWVAVARSFVKNTVLAIMFPFCFALFLFQFNRTGYDIMCNTLVVEYNPNPRRRNWP